MDEAGGKQTMAPLPGEVRETPQSRIVLDIPAKFDGGIRVLQRDHTDDKAIRGNHDEADPITARKTQSPSPV